MFLLVTFGQKNDVTWDSNDSLMNQWMWLIIYAATKVKSVDKNCPPIKFIGQHRVSYLGHKRPKMLKNSECQAYRVDTILGQCVSVFTCHSSHLGSFQTSCIWNHRLPLLDHKPSEANELEASGRDRIGKASTCFGEWRVWNAIIYISWVPEQKRRWACHAQETKEREKRRMHIVLLFKCMFELRKTCSSKSQAWGKELVSPGW